MGIIKAVINSVKGGFADQWLEVLEADNMGDTVVFTKGVKVRPNDKRNSNKKGTDDFISDGSIIHVYPNQFMMLVDGGKIIDFTAEEGYYKVDNKSAPSMFSGSFGKSIGETFGRIKYGGVPSAKQKAYFVNLQEIKGLKFGTKSPINYFDNFYNSELFLRAHGNYSIKITDPLKFYAEVVAKNKDYVDINSINEQYLSEFLEALQAAINQMSVDNIRISQVTSKARELSKYMSEILDEEWKERRGFEVLSVGLASISYDDESKKLINMRNQGAMLGDATVREGYVQGAMARGFEAAGSNSGGSATAFMGMGMGMGAGGNFMSAASRTNADQMERDESRKASERASAKAIPEGGWKCGCGTENSGKFCGECGKQKPAAPDAWNCSCGKENTGKFCSDCGGAKPADNNWFCGECGAKNSGDGNFCGECGSKRNKN